MQHCIFPLSGFKRIIRRNIFQRVSRAILVHPKPQTHLEDVFVAVDHVLRVELDLLKYSQGLFEESVSRAKVEA